MYVLLTVNILDADLHVVPEDGEVVEALTGADRGRWLRQQGGCSTAASHAHLVRAWHVCTPQGNILSQYMT